MIELTREGILENGEMMPGSVAFYRVKNNTYETIYSSGGIPALLGMSARDYQRKTGLDAVEAICPQDRPSVIAALRKCVEDGAPIDIYYRVHHAVRGFNWVHAKGTLCGCREGCPVLFLCSPALRRSRTSIRKFSTVRIA